MIPEDVPVIIWVLLFAILFTQATWLFVDARRRGFNPWFWGLWGCIHFPLPFIAYWLFKRDGLQVIKNLFNRSNDNE
ncbi:MAG: sigmaY antisigma factor component [Gorillibacterium sp.]|nr:sigmaY antisigma factor component [Gorillibacterium sp.]